MSEDQRLCSRCVSDTTIPGIRFDAEGICNFCVLHDRLEQIYPLGEQGEQARDRLLQKVKDSGRGKAYDCIVGVSGGTDSTYTLYLTRKHGLRPLAVHLNNTWNSDIATRNMERAVEALGVEFRELHCDWDEFRDLQTAFLRASVPEAEIPTDVAIHAILHQVAAREGVRYVLNGHSFRTEGIAPIGWTYMDGRYIKDVQRKFGTRKLESFPNLTLFDVSYYAFIKRVRTIAFLNFFPYSKEKAREVLAEEVGWTYYGGHHFESVYTRFIIAHVLWRKFGIDKRKITLSARVRSGLISRQEAVDELATELTIEQDVVDHCIGRLGLSGEEFDRIMEAEPKSFRDYSTYYSFLRACRIPIKIACKLGIFSPILYYKFFS